jgi:hypothetical protein
MSRFRLFLAWLILAAIPLQGLAASSMLFCGMGGHHAPSQVASAQAHLASSGSSASVGHDHSKHSHASDVQAKKAAHNAGKKLPDAAHKCAVCASCCNIVAIFDFPQLAAIAPVPQAELAEPFLLIHARPSQVPDKPPRA